VPPMRRLRSVIASTNGSLAPPPSQAEQAARTPEWRVHELSRSPPSPPQQWRREAPLPPRPPPPEHFRQQSAGYSRYAYDDFSEDDSDPDMDRSSVSSKVKCGCPIHYFGMETVKTQLYAPGLATQHPHPIFCFLWAYLQWQLTFLPFHADAKW
jgi:hypothetical protein